MKEDDRRRHMYIIGQTGTGKSELMKFLAVQDIKNGKGVAFMDPHGSAVKDILTQIPEDRIDDVIYFNPGDEDFPMGLNLLDVKTPRQRDLVINSFIELLYKLYDPNKQGIVGPQLERAVRNGMQTIMQAVPGGTMVEVMRLVIDENYQKELIEKITDPLVKRYWTDEMANTQAFHKSEKTGYFVSKFDRFVTEHVMRNIIGQSKSAFDFGEVMDQKKILLIDLNKGILGEENSKFLGLLLVPRLLGAAFQRANSSNNDFDDFYFYVDEFQNFSTPDFVTILSEARKYKLNLMVANQFLSQMDESIKNAIFGNVGTLTSFRVGQDDGKYMADQFAPTFTENDLINLQVGKTAIRLLVDGHPTPPFSLTTDWPAMENSPRSSDIAARIIQNSRKKYGRPVQEVTKEIDDRSGLSAPKKPPMPTGGGFGMPGRPGAMPPRPTYPPTNTAPSAPKPFSSGQTPFSQTSKPLNPTPGVFNNSPAGYRPPNPYAYNSMYPPRPAYPMSTVPRPSYPTSPVPNRESPKPGIEKIDAKKDKNTMSKSKSQVDSKNITNAAYSKPNNPASPQVKSNFPSINNSYPRYTPTLPGNYGFNPSYNQSFPQRPLDPKEGGPVMAKRGAISLADLDSTAGLSQGDSKGSSQNNSTTPAKKSYKENPNTFNNTKSTPPPRNINRSKNNIPKTPSTPKWLNGDKKL